MKGEATGDELICLRCGAKHRGQGVSSEAEGLAIAGEHLPTDETFEVIESTPDLLRLRLKRLSRPLGTSLIMLMGLSLASVWIGLAFLVWNQISAANRPGLPVIALAAGIVGFTGSLVALYALRGDSTIELTRERLTYRGRAGLSRFERSAPTTSIESIRLVDLSGAGNAESLTCVVFGTQGTIPLTRKYSTGCSRRVLDRVRNQLAEWGQLSLHD